MNKLLECQIKNVFGKLSFLPKGLKPLLKEELIAAIEQNIRKK